MREGCRRNLLGHMAECYLAGGITALLVVAMERVKGTERDAHERRLRAVLPEDQRVAG